MNITTGKKDKPRRCLLYGTNGIGKSTFANAAPNPIFIQTEEGLSDIDVNAAFDFGHNFDTVLAQLYWLYTDDHDYKTVIIDTLDFLERLIWKEVAKDEGKDGVADIGYSNGYKLALKYWEKILDALNALWNTKNLNVILLAHAKTATIKDPENGPYDKYMPKLHDLPSDMLQDWCDEVFFCRHKLYITEHGDGFNKSQKATDSGQRVIYCAEGGTHAAKNKLGLPSEIPLDFAVYQEYIDKNKASKTKPVAEATQKKAETK